MGIFCVWSGCRIVDELNRRWLCLMRGNGKGDDRVFCATLSLNERLSEAFKIILYPNRIVIVTKSVYEAVEKTE